MNRKEVIAFLNEVEESLPVNEWRIGEIMIWPIIKWDIFSKWYESENPNSIGNVNNELYKGKFVRFRKLLLSLFCVIKLLSRKHKQVDTIYCGASTYRVDYGNEYINKYFQPLMGSTSVKDSRYLQIEYSPPIAGKNYKDVSSIIFMNDLYPIIRLCLVFNNKRELNLPDFSLFKRRVETELQLDLSGFYSSIHRKFISLKAFTIISEFLLKKYRPKLIFGLSYYNLPMTAIHYAANKLAISNIDLQHGGQGPLHPMYNYSAVPKNGYNTLPQKFYTWDKVSANTIRSWSVEQNFHEVSVFGNPWIKFQLDKHQPETNISGKRIILFTLQEYLLDGYLLQAIKETPDEFEWWIRLHPRMLESKKDFIIKQLQDYNITSHIEVTKATTLPLPQLLSIACVHISKYSGSIIEGVQCNTPSIVIDPIGAEIYQEYIAEGLVKTVLSKNSNDLLACILSFQQSNH